MLSHLLTIQVLQQPEPTLRQQLQAFRQATRQLVLHTMPQQTHRLIQGKVQAGKRLAPLGINTHLATLPWQPCLSHTTQHRLATEVLRSQYRLSYAKASHILSDHHKLATRPAQLKGRTQWSATIKPQQQELYHTTHHHHTPTTAQGCRADGGSPPASVGEVQGTHRGAGASSTTPADFDSRPDLNIGADTKRTSEQKLEHPSKQSKTLPSIIFLQCPRCTHKLPGTKAAFDTNSLDSRIWCNSCQKQLFVRQWRCSCGLHWHTCPERQQSL